jgi:hypothetical protein
MSDSFNNAAFFFRMPKNQKDDKQKNAGAEIFENNDDFEGMLAEFRMADLAAPKASSSPSAKSNAFNDFPESAAASNRAPIVSEETILSACKAGDIMSIRWWDRRGVRILCFARLLSWGKLM